MGCGKSKHAVETATTITKSSKSDGGKETHTTKTVTDASVVQHEVETTSRVVEDTKKETKTTKIEPSVVANTNNVAPLSGENVGEAVEVVKEDEKVNDFDSKRVHDTTTIDNVTPTPVVEEKKEFKPLADNEAKTDNVVPTPSKDDVSATKVVKEDEEKKESNLIVDNETKTDSVPPVEVKETRKAKVAKDNNVKAEFMTPRMGEEVVEAVKDDAEVKDPEEEGIEGVISNEDSAEAIDDDSSIPNDDNPEVVDQEVVDSVVDSPKEETDKEEDLEVTEEDAADEETLPETTEPKKVSGLKEANTADTQEKKP